MKRLLAFYLFCTIFGIYAIHKAYSLIGSFELYDSRHSVAFYTWEVTGGIFLLIAAIGVLLLIFEIGLDK